MRNLAQWLSLPLKGMAMGIAEVIPGVSGGTLAFITGIYERLINAIKNMLSPQPFQELLRGDLRSFWRIVDGQFLLLLLAGMALGIIVGVLGVSHLMETYPVLLWAFFFGLIIASALLIGRQVQSWTPGRILALLLATAAAYWITILDPGQGSESLLMIFLSGAIAISALILPGISGSFILLLMGMYTIVIPTVKEALSTFSSEAITLLLIFGLGCLVGLATFSRLLSWTFRQFPDFTLAVLTGFMIGSLNKIWPWRNVLSYRSNSDGEQEPLLEKSVLPAHYEGDPMLYTALGLMLLGFFSIYLVDLYARRQKPTP